jgi:CHAD domain-containing protein
MALDAGHRERELKLRADLDFELPDLSEVVARSLRLPERQLHTAYFDTSDLRLWARDVTFRHRLEDGIGTWTLKLPGATAGQILERTELSWLGRRESFPPEALDLLRGVVRRSPLLQVAELTTTRRRLAFHDATGAAWGELDDDTVTVTGGPHGGLRFRQLEVELEPGDHLAAKRVVKQLRRAGAQLGDGPKLAKALDIPRLALTRPQPRALGPRSALRDVVQASVAAGLERLLDHDLALRAGGQAPRPEDIHQARVAARRLRSDLKTLAPVLDAVWVRHARAELQWLGGLLGQVRDVDVLTEHLAARGGEAPIDVAGRTGLRSRLEDQRRDASRELADALSSDRYCNLVDRLHAASLRPPLVGLVSASGVGSPAASQPAGVALPDLVGIPWDKLRRQVRKAGRHPDAHQLHRIRIRAKQVRYASEAASPVVGRAAQRTARAAEDLQAVLGEHHDSVEAEVWLRRAAGSGECLPAETFVAGRLTAEQHRRQDRLARKWQPEWDKLAAKKGHRWLT